MEPNPYGVESSANEVAARSAVRLAFEPKGDMVNYRHELRTALRGLGRAQGPVLLAEYASPDQAHADLENVLLYNVGASAYSHLVDSGVICRRLQSTDSLHHVRYSQTDQVDWPDFHGMVLATSTVVDAPLRSSPLSWWRAFREAIQPASGQHLGQVAVSVKLGRALQDYALTALVKPLMDGLVSALHAHDGSNADHLSALLPDEQAWELITDPSAAVLGRRRLVRPHGRGLAWNPADERCAAFRILRTTEPEAVTAVVSAF